MPYIVVVDDDSTTTTSLTRLLTNEGFSVRTVDNAREALEMLGRLNIDLIISEAKLGEMSGLDFCRELRRSYVTPFTFLSTLNAPKEKAAGLRVGADDYVGKPYDPIEFVLRVWAVLRRSNQANQIPAERMQERQQS